MVHFDSDMRQRIGTNRQDRRYFGLGPITNAWLAAGLWLAMCAVTGCGRHPAAGEKAADGRTTIKIWAHHGKPEEWKTVQAQVKRFNQSQTNVFAQLVEIAEANYDTQVQSAAASRQLPDVLEFDGPMLANYAWKGYLKPLEGLSVEVQSDLLPSIVQQGTYGGKFFAVGTFDSGLGLFANRRLLEEVNARIPTNEPAHGRFLNSMNSKRGWPRRRNAPAAMARCSI